MRYGLREGIRWWLDRYSDGDRQCRFPLCGLERRLHRQLHFDLVQQRIDLVASLRRYRHDRTRRKPLLQRLDVGQQSRTISEPIHLVGRDQQWNGFRQQLGHPPRARPEVVGWNGQAERRHDPERRLDGDVRRVALIAGGRPRQTEQRARQIVTQQEALERAMRRLARAGDDLPDVRRLIRALLVERGDFCSSGALDTLEQAPCDALGRGAASLQERRHCPGCGTRHGADAFGLRASLAPERLGSLQRGRNRVLRRHQLDGTLDRQPRQIDVINVVGEGSRITIHVRHGFESNTAARATVRS